MSEHEVTLGEVYRTLKRQDSVLDGILLEVRKTNGTVGRHETRISLLEARAQSDDPPKPKRTGLTLTLSAGGAIGAWEVIKKVFGLG